MTENVKVVVGPEALEDAYSSAYDRFSGMDEVDAEDFQFHQFAETANWANNVNPHLRAAAGYSDNYGGTYTDENTVVVVDNSEDRPMDGYLTDSSHVHEQLVSAYRTGVIDGITGDSKDIDSVMPLL